MSLMTQELLTLPAHLRSPPVVSRISVAQFVVFLCSVLRIIVCLLDHFKACPSYDVWLLYCYLQILNFFFKIGWFIIYFWMPTHETCYDLGHDSLIWVLSGATCWRGTAYPSGTPEFTPFFFTCLSCSCCQITCLYVFRSVLLCPPRFPRKNDVRFILTPIICIYLRMMLSNTISISDNVRVV